MSWGAQNSYSLAFYRKKIFAYRHRLSDLSPSVYLHVYIYKNMNRHTEIQSFVFPFVYRREVVFICSLHLLLFFLLNSVSLRWFYVSIFISISPFLTSSSISCLFPVPFIYKAIGPSSIWSNNFSEDSPIHILCLCLKYVSLSSILIIHPFISSFYTFF